MFNQGNNSHIFFSKALKPSFQGNLTSMDAAQIKKIQAMNRYKRRQLLDNLYFYFLTALTCILFCCTTLCLPCISTLLRVFFFVRIPSYLNVLLSSKFLFIIGNFIIVVLVIDSRILSSSNQTNEVYYDEYIKSSQRPQNPIPKKGNVQLKKHVSENVERKKEHKEGCEGEGYDEEEEEEPSLHSDSDELNRRADDFIARINKQKRLELSLLQCGRL